MNGQMRQLTLIFLGLVTLWDCFTTVTGTFSLIGSGAMPMIMSVICAIFVSGMLINSVPIIKSGGEDLFDLLKKGLLLVCVIYDFYTAFVGNRSFATNGEGNWFVILLMTIITTSSPVALSYFIYEND